MRYPSRWQTQVLPDVNLGHIQVRIIVQYSIARTLQKSLAIEVALWALSASNGQYTVVCLDYDPLPSRSTALRVSLLQLAQDD